MAKQLTPSDVYDVNKKTGALILGANRLDDYAEKFLGKYCRAALTTPMSLPVEKMLADAGLTVRTASLSRNLDIFGCCLLLDGFVEVYDREKDEYVPTFFNAGTLVFDPESEWAYGEGCKRNTLIHEMIHWEKDKRYFEILELKNQKAKEQLYPIMCCQSQTNFEPPARKQTKQNEVEWLEWQAHRLAPRILMPRMMFIQKAEEYLCGNPGGCDELVDRLADFFKVSRSSAKIRLVEVGFESRLVAMPDYQDVFGELKRREHIAITPEDAYALMAENDILAQWIESNHMVFADGYFVIADTRYVTVRNGLLHLTKRARNNLAACTINICEQHIVSHSIAEKDYRCYAALFYAQGVDERFLSFHPKYQAGFASYLKQEEEKGKESGLYEVTDDDVYDAVIAGLFSNEMSETKKKFIQMLADPFTTLCQALWYWFENNGLSKPYNFRNATLLHANYHTDIKNDKKNNMERDTLMAICVGCGFDLRLTQMVLKKANISLDEFAEPDRTYLTLLERFPGISIDDFNKILSRRNLKELGTASKVG